MTAQKTSPAAGPLRIALDQQPVIDGGRVVADSIEAWLTTARDCQRELTEFVSSRLAKDTTTMRELLNCKNPGEAVALQTRWVQETMQDYSAEMSKVLTIYTKHATDVAQTGQ